MGIRGVCLSNPNLETYRAHRHACWEITLNISGSGTITQNGQPLPFGPGTILISPPGVLHGKKAASGCFQDIYIQFDSHYLLPSLPSFLVQDDEDRTIETLMRMIFHSYYRRQTGGEAIIQHLFEALCRSLVSLANQARGRKSGLIQNEILQNFTNPEFKIGDILEKTGYCADYVRRCFKEELHMTPVEFLNRTRIDYAKRLLTEITDPAYTVSEVAFLSGFYDMGYFSRVFKKLEHLTPLEYRARITASA